MKLGKIHVDIVDTFEKFQGERVKGFSQFVVENLNLILNESDYQEEVGARNPDYQKEVDARVKVQRNLLWINARKGFFAQLLSKLNIYGVSDPEYQTMCTNGFNIQYHPDFVLGQSDAAIRFVLCHEILHCVGDHMSRRGSRDPKIWNYACDFAINPILNVEVVGGAFEWPTNLDGSRMGLYEEKFEGMKAEDIYDILAPPSSPPPPGGGGDGPPPPGGGGDEPPGGPPGGDGGMPGDLKKMIEEAFKDDPGKGIHVIDADKGLKKPKGDSVVQNLAELENAPEDIESPDLDVGDDYGPSSDRTGKVKNSSKKYTSKEALGKGGSKAEASTKWSSALRDAMSRAGSTLSDKARRLLTELKSSKPKVNWKKELKKFMDSAMTKFEDVLPNKRFLGSGDVLYGTELAGKDTLKTLVLPVDTSGSISKDQIGAFLTEVFSLATKFDIDVTYIVYTSDSIDSIDVVPKGKKPDLSMIKSTGGNREGFFPPFRFIKEPKKYQGKANAPLPKSINPSTVIYFTDTFAEYPTKNDFGIGKYANRVFWFICLNKDQNFNKPPFGRYIHVPIDSKGNFT